jgi:ribosomal protein S27AE
MANEGAFLRYHGDVEQLVRQNLAEEPTVMSPRRRVSAIYGIIILGGLLALALAAGLNTPLPFFGWLLAGGVATMLARCPTCGKSVFNVERRRATGFSVGYWPPKPERRCSRCGRVLLEDPSASS